jgi:hypothetical protein
LIISVLIGLALHVVPLRRKCRGIFRSQKSKLTNLIRRQKQLNKSGNFAKTSTPYSRARQTACGQAVGNTPFCNCLGEKLPWVLSFQEYVSAVTSTKEGLAAADLSNEQRGVVDKAVKARDECVASTFGRK